MDAIEHYDLSSSGGLIFTFVSTGQKDVRKVIKYTPIGRYLEREVFNLGFGDVQGMDLSTLTDQSNTNNGDMYKVFNTVLYSIPLFFELHPEVFLFVTGFDDLRKKVYRRYVRQNISSLSESYLILGCYIEEGEILAIEAIKSLENYDGYLVVQKRFI